MQHYELDHKKQTVSTQAEDLDGRAFCTENFEFIKVQQHAFAPVPSPRPKTLSTQNGTIPFLLHFGKWCFMESQNLMDTVSVCTLALLLLLK